MGTRIPSAFGGSRATPTQWRRWLGLAAAVAGPASVTDGVPALFDGTTATVTRQKEGGAAEEQSHDVPQHTLDMAAVTFALRRDPVLAEQQGFSAESEIQQASASLVSVLQSVATAGIWFGIVWLPILLALAIIGLAGLFIGRRLTRSPAGGDSPMPPASAGA